MFGSSRSANRYSRSQQQQQQQPPRVDHNKILIFFKEYADSDGLKISEDGTEKLCTDAGFSVVDPVALVLCFHCGVKTMGIFTKDEFLKGMTELNCIDIDELRKKLPFLRNQLKPTNVLCKKIYQSVFIMSLDEGQKQLSKDIANETWKLLLPLYGNAELVERWCNWIEIENKKPAISKDTWNMVFDLITTCTPDLSNFDIDGAWPVLIDEFVEYQKKHGGDNVQA